MTHVQAPVSAICSILLVMLFTAGCMATTVGDARYANGSVVVGITQSGDPADVVVQVTAYRIANLTQEKYVTASAPASLARGENTVNVPVTLPPGSYKLYIYVLADGDRKTAVIRDIGV